MLKISNSLPKETNIVVLIIFIVVNFHWLAETEMFVLNDGFYYDVLQTLWVQTRGKINIYLHPL